MDLIRRHTTFVFTLRPAVSQVEALWRHAGAARFAYNQALALHIGAKKARARGEERAVPDSGFDFINAFNTWKRSPEANTPTEPSTAEPRTAGAPEASQTPAGLPWRNEVFQGVFEEACVDLGEAMTGRAAWFKGARRGRCPGLARFKKRGRVRPSFRIRNRAPVVLGPDPPDKRKGTVRFAGAGEAGRSSRWVHLPAKVGGVFRIREDTRRLRRLLAKPATTLRYVTLAFEDDRWRLSVTVETGPLHPAERVAVTDAHPVGIDRGLSTFAVLATASGEEVERIAHPRPLRAALPRLRRRSRAHAKKEPGSANRRRAQRRLQRLHARIRNIRRDFARRAGSRLAKTHGHLVLETLNTQGLMKTRMARALADSGWAQFATRLKHRTAWHGGQVTEAERTFPSTRRCSSCGEVGEAVPLSQRQFHCRRCGFEADRDTNAAVNLGQYPSLPLHAAEKPSEAQNACGEGSAGSTRPRPNRVKLPSTKQE